MRSIPTRRQLPVFVYGTLRPGESNFDRLLAGVTTASSDATLARAVMYAGPGFPYVTIGDGTVVGNLIDVAVDEYEDTIARLDMLEGDMGPDRQNHYDRTILSVTTAAGEQLEAWVYLAGTSICSGLDSHQRIHSGDWLADVFVGAGS